MISGEVRSATTGSIGAVLLGRLHEKGIFAPRTPASDIVQARCVAAAVTKEAEKERWGQFLHRVDHHADD
jgi:hypothetical protein